ncbi:aldo/keto reductase [Actinopolyspora mortivallis]|uniref:D-threo-aldose 1-dehydrogenase n=1 Tax=Actinopolyspora mortivallis TaxID=33906 RepID=A0A2T0GUS1_ACTMO|nr:aldo/keto reductase [Actinopolyspora mortivallis]PRW62868.1 D-threo-aldose 1-dehydrogenase [Actinopolyspora mortivallis]
MSIRSLVAEHTLGFGAAPLGNMFRAVPEEDALATVETAWKEGIRYYDTAPIYGAGLSENRLGQVLSQYPRSDYVLSTKVGRVIEEGTGEPAESNPEGEGLFAHGLPNRVVDDYTYDGTLRAVEQSLRRLRTDHIDIAWVHDVSPDFHGDDWIDAFATARTGAFRALESLREQGVVRAWGLGVNTVEPCELVLGLEEPRPDAFLLAGRYTLFDHAHAAQRLLPTCEERGVDLVVGGPFNSGVLAGGEHFEYRQASAEVLDRVRRLREVAENHGVDLKAAALRFPTAHPAVAATIPGMSRPERVNENLELSRTPIPEGLWRQLREERLVSAEVPLPAGD